MTLFVPAAGSHHVQVGHYRLPGILAVPPAASGIVIFAHGSGSSRFSVRNQQVAGALNRVGFATLLFDLLRPEEEMANNRARVFDISLLADRLVDAVHWVDGYIFQALPIGLFGASTGAAAALVTAATCRDRVAAVVSRGGRPDLAGEALERVRAPTLLIVGGNDDGVVELNQQALERIAGLARLAIVPGATHLFPEPGAMDEVIRLATGWFEEHLTPTPS